MKEKRRYFGGKLFVPKKSKERTPEEKQERNVEKAHLKAYLRGDRYFHHISFGRDSMRRKLYHKVLQY